MSVLFSPHALERLAERNMSPNMVVALVTTPEQLLDEESRTVAQSRCRDATTGKEYLVRVFFERHGEDGLVVSVCRTSEVRKYWREEES